MDPATVHALYDALRGDRLSFLYSGLFHDEHTARLITLGEEFLEHDGVDKSVKGKLAFIMVEAYQNIVRHRAPVPADLEQGPGRSMFVLRSAAARHKVIAVNPVSNADAARLTTDLGNLGRMSMEQMKEVFLNGLKSEERTERGGAGLGLIEMSRRSGKPLRYGFSPLSADRQLFTLQVLIGKGAEWKSPPEAVFNMHQWVAQEGISVLFRGHLDAGEQEVVLRIIERDLDDDHSRADARTRAFLAVMELLENLGPVGEGPMIMMGRVGTKVTLVLATPLPLPAAQRLVASVNEVNAMDAQTLQRRYRDILLGRGAPADTILLGLVELARRSSQPLQLQQQGTVDSPFVVLEAVI